MADSKNLRLIERVRRKIRNLVSVLIVLTIARWLNLLEMPFMFEYRPDFHSNKKNFPSFQKFARAWTSGNMTNNGGDFARLYMLYQNAKIVFSSGVAGDVVELGVYKGNSAFLLAELARNNGRSLFLFDTFRGFDARDFVREDVRNSEKHFSDTSLQDVKRLVGDGDITYVEGYFPESLASIQPLGAIAIAHIDCDLYEPMRAALETFYPLMSPGGAMIMHDYASGEWPGATRAVDEFFAGKPERPIVIPDKSGTAVVRKSFS